MKMKMNNLPATITGLVGCLGLVLAVADKDILLSISGVLFLILGELYLVNINLERLKNDK